MKVFHGIIEIKIQPAVRVVFQPILTLSRLNRLGFVDDQVLLRPNGVPGLVVPSCFINAACPKLRMSR